MLSHYFEVKNEDGKIKDFLKHKHVFFILTYRVNIIFHSQKYEGFLSFNLSLF